MNSKVKMFVFLVALGFGSSMLFSMIPWESYEECIRKGMMPDFTNKDNCIELGTPSAFGSAYTFRPISEISFI